MTSEIPNGFVVNAGVQQTGGHSQVGNQAIGTGAQAIAGTVAFQSAGPEQRGEAADLLALLTLIERLLAEHRDSLPDQTGTQVELRRLREELDEAEPQQGVVRRALERLTEFVRPVAPLVVAVGQLAQAVQGVVGS